MANGSGPMAMRIWHLLLAGLLVPAATAASIDHTSPIPSGGDYTLTVAVSDFELGKDGGIQFVKNGKIVAGSLTSLSHEFPGLKTGDWISAELVDMDGDRLFPRAYAALLVRDEQQTPGMGAPMVLIGLIALALVRRP